MERPSNEEFDSTYPHLVCTMTPQANKLLLNIRLQKRITTQPVFLANPIKLDHEDIGIQSIILL